MNREVRQYGINIAVALIPWRSATPEVVVPAAIGAGRWHWRVETADDEWSGTRDTMDEAWSAARAKAEELMR